MNTPVIHVSDEVYKKLPGLILITGKAKMGEPDVKGISEYLNKSWVKLGDEIGPDGPKAHPLINTWRETLRSVGVPVKECPPSIEAIGKRAIKGGAPFSINPIVDTYNALSMDLALPLGAYNVSDMNGELHVRLSTGGEKFTALGSNETDVTVANEIIFSDSSDVLTRHFLWRQSEKCKITPQTSEFIFVCELMSVMGEELVEKAQTLIQSKFLELLKCEIVDLQVLRKA